MNQRKGTTPIYHEIQQFRQVWIWVTASALTGLVWYAAVMQLLLHRPFGNRPMSDISLVINWFLFGIGLPALFLIARLVTEVRNDGIYIRFFPFHWTFRKIAFTEVKQFKARTYRSFREYGGHGIRYGSKGMAYTVSGDRGVQIELLNGKRLLIGSQRAEELSRAIQIKYGNQESKDT